MKYQEKAVLIRHGAKVYDILRILKSFILRWITKKPRLFAKNAQDGLALSGRVAAKYNLGLAFDEQTSANL